ncbi:MAG TPA: fibronectin type III domain-containing protein [Streptomyces sp.]|uniref:fibronectin type III domain-containing protein n=1 Tax=Streptomyces sp. TaxID=1931 RepID=UPI002D44C71A|nr:fibronectin type III domain-containing protein [Streptomyces sp.]HZG05554.1 fibronectin type III domain-containing protein [Streptomyces sp.]
MGRASGPAALVSVCLLLTACGTEKGDTRPPSAPTGVTAQAGSATSVHVMWNSSTDDTEVTGYEVHRSGRKVKDVPGERHMVDIGGLKPSTAHTFTVRARDAAGNLSPYSAKVSVTTPAAAPDDHAPPTRPEGLRGRAEGSRAATLTWRRSADDQGVASYDILQGGTRIHRVPGGETTALVTGLRPGVRYTFTVVARDAADNASPASRAVRVTTASEPGGGPGTAPAGFRATGRAADDGYHIDLSWVPPKTGGRVTQYEIHLDGKLATTLNWAADTPRGRVSYSLYAGEKPGVTHTVRLRARLPDGTWGAFSARRTVTLGEE